MAELTQERLKEVIDYSPILGLFWHIKARGGVKVGDVAGSKDNKGYIRIGIDGRLHKAHRLAWLYVHGEWPPDQIDHENNDTSDNRLFNLRLASNGQNRANSRKKTSSIYKGVRWRAQSRKWHTQIGKDGQNHHVGLFDSPVDAARAYDAKAIELFGEYAKTNFGDQTQ